MYIIIHVPHGTDYHTSTVLLLCRSTVNALRCCMLLCEVLKERGLYRELTQVCIKMTTEVHM